MAAAHKGFHDWIGVQHVWVWLLISGWTPVTGRSEFSVVVLVGRWWRSMCGLHHRCMQLAWQLVLDDHEIRPSAVYVTVCVHVKVFGCDVHILVTSEYKLLYGRKMVKQSTKMVSYSTHADCLGLVARSENPCVIYSAFIMGNGLGREERVMYWKISLSAPPHYLS